MKAVFATNDQMALGAVEAIAAHNLTGRVQVVGFDTTREAVRAVVARRLSGDMAGLPEVMGRKTLEEAIQAACPHSLHSDSCKILPCRRDDPTLPNTFRRRSSASSTER